MSGIPNAAVGFLLENLKEFVLYNADLFAGAEDNARSLCQELETLRGYLKKCTEEYSDDDFLGTLAKKVREFVYRAEDAIETYIATASKHKARGRFRDALHAIDHAMDLRSIGMELETITQEAQKLYNTMFGLGIGIETMKLDKGHEKRVKKPPGDDDMVGFKDAATDVMKFLNEGSDDLQTFSIVGMLGLGKTTLAREVYKHPTVEYEFFIRAFVEVSAEYKKREVFLKLLRAYGIYTDEMNKMVEDDLQQEIKKFLTNRKFLVVLDDVWMPAAWDDLKGCFPRDQKHSRVLITTRHKNVAKHAWQGLGLDFYQLRFLTKDESRELLRRRVFGKNQISPDLEVHEVGILDRCDGLPLSIVIIAGILTNHPDEADWWKRVAQNVDTYNLARTEQANYAIRLSFNNLPDWLKPCFLYLGVFREDSEISTKSLLKLWVSEGFVPLANGNETSEDIAEDYLDQLVERSLVMVESRRLNGRIKTIRIHDELREFCKEQAIDEKFFREVKNVNNEQGWNVAAEVDRRLCINVNVLEYIRSRPSGKFVRSFLSFGKEDFSLPAEHISNIPEAFKLLKVLDIRSIKFTRLPTELFYLFLLKHFALCCDQKVIPEKLSNLRYLQNLIFKTTQRSLEIKADIWKMNQLRHLETNASTSLVRTREAASVNPNLQTLSAISPGSCTADVFDRARQLKKLGICGNLAPAWMPLVQAVCLIVFQGLISLKI